MQAVFVAEVEPRPIKDGRANKVFKAVIKVGDFVVGAAGFKDDDLGFAKLVDVVAGHHEAGVTGSWSPIIIHMLAGFLVYALSSSSVDEAIMDDM